MEYSLVPLLIVFTVGSLAGALLTWLLREKRFATERSGWQMSYHEQLLAGKDRDEQLALKTQALAIKEAEASRLETLLAERQVAYETSRQQAEERLSALIAAKASLESELDVLKATQKQWQDNLELQWKQQLEHFLLQNVESVQKQAEQEHHNKQKLLDEKLGNLLKPVTELLQQYQDKVHQLDKVQHANAELIQAELRRLHASTSQLGAALSYNKGRGDWGELELIRLLEDSGLVEGVGYLKQNTLANGKKRPDIRVLLPEGRSLFIDAKALQIDLTAEAEEETELHQEAAFKAKCDRYARSLKEAVKTLAQRDYQAELQETADFVILYVPRESMLSYAYMADQSLIQWAYSQRVMLASPLNLMALLRLVHHSWKMAKLSQDASNILELGSALYKRALTFTDRFEKINKALDSLNKAYVETHTALNGRQGILLQLRKLEEYGCDSAKKLPEATDLSDQLVLHGQTPAAADQQQGQELTV